MKSTSYQHFNIDIYFPGLCWIHNVVACKPMLIFCITSVQENTNKLYQYAYELIDIYIVLFININVKVRRKLIRTYSKWKEYTIMQLEAIIRSQLRWPDRFR